MGELQKTVPWGVRLKHALRMSFLASLVAGIAGVIVFLAIAQYASPGGGKEPLVDPDFFLVVVNVVPCSVVLGVLSFAAQLTSKPLSVDLAMLGVAITLVWGLLGMFSQYADASSVSDRFYLLGVLVPGVTMIVAHGLFFRLNAENRGFYRAMRGVA